MRRFRFVSLFLTVLVIFSTLAATPAFAAGNPPPAPSGIKAASVSNSQIKVTWNASASATSYIVYRSKSASGSYAKIATTSARSYTNTGLTANTVYYYKVKAVNSKGTSGYGAAASARTRTAAPTELKAAAVGASSIRLTWKAVSGATKYYIYRCGSASGTYAKVGEAAAPAYTNTSLASGTSYYYKVAAVNAGGVSAMSAYASARTQGSSLPAPGFKCTNSEDIGGEIKAYFTPNAPVGVYRLYDSADGAHWNLAVDSTQLTFQQSFWYSDVPGKEIYLKFTSVNGATESAGNVFHFAMLAKPIGFGYQTYAGGLPGDPGYGTGTIDLTWIAVAGATKYRVIVINEIEGNQTLFDGFTDTNSIRISNLPAYKTLKYYVLPYNGSLAGPASNWTQAGIIG